MRRALIVIGLVTTLIGLSPPAVAAVSIDPVGRTVATPAFQLDFSATNPEEVTSLRWRGSATMTAPSSTGCGDPLQYFGNSWANPDSGLFRSLVGWGQAGTWSPGAPGEVVIESASESASGCFGSQDIPVHTSYRFWDSGPYVDRFKVTRTFSFTSPFEYDFRPFIPRLLDTFGTILHPNATGTTLLLGSGDCGFGCQVTDWNDSWFAIHGSGTGSGVIVVQDAPGQSMDLWIDYDGGTPSTNATGALLVAPPGGFVGEVEVETLLCFYDQSTWTPSLDLPDGCLDSFDDDDGSIFEPDIEWLVEQEITLGCVADGSLFCPDDGVTRGQMAAFLYRALDLPAATSNPFTDVGTSGFDAEIAAVAQEGITQGCNPEGTEFCPDGVVTRGQMAAFLARALDLPDGAVNSFTDDDDSIFEADIAKIALAGITQGCNAGGTEFCPDDPVTRGQMAAFLNRALGTG